MDDDVKKKLDVFEGLRKGAWEDFNNRRIYEWKITISIWTALAGFIALILTSRVGISLNIGHVIFSIIVIVVMWLIHAFFIYKLSISNRIDRDKQFLYENKIIEILKIEFDNELQKNIKKRRDSRKKNPLLDWSGLVEIGITTILLIVAFFSIYLTSPYKLLGGSVMDIVAVISICIAAL